MLLAQKEINITMNEEEEALLAKEALKKGKEI
jgi:hypothetical protein